MAYSKWCIKEVYRVLLTLDTPMRVIGDRRMIHLTTLTFTEKHSYHPDSPVGFLFKHWNVK